MDVNKILYGKDEEKFIVGISPVGDGQVHVYTRNSDKAGDVKERKESFQYIIWTDMFGASAAEKAVGRIKEVRELSGENRLNRLLIFSGRRKYYAARKALRRDNHNMYTVSSPVDAFLHQSGKTMFAGMTGDDLHMLAVDIETWRPDGFAQAKQDPIVIVSLYDNKGFEKVLYWLMPGQNHPGKMDPAVYIELPDEELVLQELVKWINRRDPDVILGHNVFGYDLPFISKRSEIHGVHFGIGRDGKEPYTYSAEKKFAERDIDYTNFLVNGRAVLDTMFMAYDWDVFARELPNFKLKDIAKHFGLAAEGRTYIDGDQIADVWAADPHELLQYALDDVKETVAIAEHLLGSTLALTQMVPMNMQRTHLAGSAATIQTFFVREYYRQNHSLPVPESGNQKFGGLTEIYQTGKFENVWYIDVESLYPSIMLKYGMKPETDKLDLFQTLLQNLTDLRFEAKDIMREHEEGTRLYNKFEAKQSALKIIINSFYGMLGAGHKALFSTVSEADRVAETGQGLLRLMMEFIVDEGGDIIEVDTDGVLCVTPEGRDLEEDGPRFCSLITDLMPEGITVGFDGAYPRMLSIRKKNYALLKSNGKVKITGGSLKSRGLEPLFRDYLTDQITTMLQDDLPGLRKNHEKYKARIISGVSPELLAKTVTLKDSLAEYQNKVADGGNRAAHYEIAMAQKREGKRVGKGDRVSYVVCGTEKPYKVRSYIDGEVLENVTRGMENRAYYLKRLNDIARSRFGILFDEDGLDILLSKIKKDPRQTDMFGEEMRSDLIEQVEIVNNRLRTIK